MVTRAAQESAENIEEFCQANAHIFLPIVNLIQNASHVVETVTMRLGIKRWNRFWSLSAKLPIAFGNRNAQYLGAKVKIPYNGFRGGMRKFAIRGPVLAAGFLAGPTLMQVAPGPESPISFRYQAIPFRLENSGRQKGTLPKPWREVLPYSTTTTMASWTSFSRMAPTSGH